MSNESVYLAAILETCAEVPPFPLAAAPLPENDLGVAQVCPECLGLDSLISEEEDGEFANCPDCGCLFTPKIESLSRQIIQRLAERRQKRSRYLSSAAEALSMRPPPGIDPDDYEAFRQAVDGPDEDAPKAAARTAGRPTL